MYQTAFDIEKVDAKEMQTLVNWLKGKTGATVNVQAVILVETDSPEISNMLDALRNSMKNGRTPKALKPRTSTPKPAGNGSMGRASRLIESTGEIVSLRELKDRIKAGSVADQTVVTNHKGARFVVMGGDLIQEPQS